MTRQENCWELRMCGAITRQTAAGAAGASRTWVEGGYQHRVGVGECRHLGLVVIWFERTDTINTGKLRHKVMLCSDTLKLKLQLCGVVSAFLATSSRRLQLGLRPPSQATLP